MAHVITRSRVPARGRKREMQWLGGIVVDRATVAANSKVQSLVLSATGLALRPFTIIRMHMEVEWRSDQVAATEGPHGALGWAVVSEQASVTGVTAMPDPVLDANFDWFTWQGLISEFTFITAAGFQSGTGSRYKVDSKAMRKVGAADDMVMVVKNHDAANGAQLSVMGRVLIKLH